MNPVATLRSWLQARLPPAASDWLEQSIARINADRRDADLYLAFSLVPRHTGKAELGLDAAEHRSAADARAHWDPSSWRVDEAARLLLLLDTGGDAALLSRRVEQLCNAADVVELVTLYRGLPLYPEPERYRLRAAEGIRTNMRVVFEAVAHRNPYPSEQLPQAAWNQMVLKALFVGSSLDPVLGLDERANPDLSHMLCDYAHERWSAGRPVSPELWRCVGPHADAKALADLRYVLEHGSELERAAAVLALSRTGAAEAARLIRGQPRLEAALVAGRLDWHAIAAGTLPNS